MSEAGEREGIERQAYLDVLDTLSAEIDDLYLTTHESLATWCIRLSKREGFLRKTRIEVYSSPSKADLPDAVAPFVDAEVQTSIVVKDRDTATVYQIRSEGSGRRYLSKAPPSELMYSPAMTEGYSIQPSVVQEVTDPNEVYGVLELIRGARLVR